MAESFNRWGYEKNVMHQTGGVDDLRAFSGGRGARETRAVDDFGDMKMGQLSTPAPSPEAPPAVVNLGKEAGGNIGRFVSYINKGGLARKNRYRVLLGGKGPNDAVRRMGGYRLEDLNLMCESVSFPAQNLRATPDALRFGPEREQVQGVTYGEISASFICSSSMVEKAFFTEWHKGVFNKASWEVEYYNMFIGSMRIIQDDRFDKQVYAVELSEVYPKTITQLELGYAQNDIYHSLSIDFQYHKWNELGSVRNIGQDY